MDVDDEFDSDSYSSSIETQPLQPVFVSEWIVQFRAQTFE